MTLLSEAVGVNPLSKALADKGECFSENKLGNVMRARRLIESGLLAPRKLYTSCQLSLGNLPTSLCLDVAQALWKDDRRGGRVASPGTSWNIAKQLQ